jgi:hypothetical protein
MNAQSETAVPNFADGVAQDGGELVLMPMARAMDSSPSQRHGLACPGHLCK